MPRTVEAVQLVVGSDLFEPLREGHALLPESLVGAMDQKKGRHPPVRVVERRVAPEHSAGLLIESGAAEQPEQK